MRTASLLAAAAFMLASASPAMSQNAIRIACSADSGRGAVVAWIFDITLSPLTVIRSKEGALTDAVKEPLCFGQRWTNLLVPPDQSRCELVQGVIFVRGSVAGALAQNYRIDLNSGHYEADWGYGIREGRCTRVN